ncbi:MAG: LysR family transcriptional regulator [Bdellovibrionales bacterium]|nr:LysR family transcriptional regulator [Bdellovibrionales bacterium]
MISNDLNLNHLRVFESVGRHRNMTLAAKELHLTQSGVSQHMKAFEDTLGVKLFDRVKQKLVPTREGLKLYEKITQELARIESAFSEVRKAHQEISGKVEVGMPIEFGNNVLVPLVAQVARKHPQIQFTLRYGFATEMNDAILKGQMDFAFIDSFSVDPRIATQKIYEETLSLCISPSRISKGAREDRALFSKLEYVDYQAGNPLLKMWFKHHMGIRDPDLNVRSILMDVQGISRLILSGVGAGVLPDHHIQKLIASGEKLHIFKGSGKPLKNSIRIAALQGKTFSKASQVVLDELRSGL